MSKKLILFLMLAVFGSTSLLKADVIEIGNPTESTSTYAPAYSLYNYSLSEQIYTADEMGGNDCTINSISFYWSSGGNATNQPNWQIYMKAVHGTFESSSDYIPVTAADLVYSGTVQLPASGSAAQWVTVTLNTPYEYSSDDDLLICVNNLTGSWWSSNKFGTFTPAEQYACLYRYQDSGAFDPTASQPSCNSMNKKNAIQLDVIPAGGSIVLTPAALVLGERPNNAWMEPACINVKNTNPDGAIVSTAIVTYPEKFDLTTMVNNVELGYKESVDVEIRPANGAVGFVESVMTVNYNTPEKDLAYATIEGTFYTAAMPDVVEFAKTIGMSAAETPDFTALHNNYNLPNAIANAKDAVYKFVINEAKKFNANMTTGHLALYASTQPKADNALMEGASFTNVTLLPGTYYIVAEAASAFTLNVNITDFPALTENPTLIAPENMASGVSVTPTLTWELPEGTVYYRLLVNSVYSLPEATSVVVDWTSDLAESFTLPELNPATQYFWRVDAKNYAGTVVKSSPKWGFTVAVPAPKNLEAEDETVFEGDNVYLKWKDGMGGGFEGEMTVCDGTTTDSSVPVYGFYADAYLRCQMVYPAEMLEDMEGGEITSLKFYLSTPSSSSWGSANFNVYMMTVPSASIAAFTDPSYATQVYTGSLSGTGSVMTVTLDTPFEYEGGNLLVGFDNTVCGSYSSCSFYGITSNGSSVQGYSYSALASVTPTQRNFLPKTTFVCGGAKSTPRSFLGYNLYQDNVKINDEIITDRRYTVAGLTYNMDGYNFGVTTVCTEGESAKSNIVNVKVSGVGGANGYVYDIDGTTPLEGATVTFDGLDEFGEEVVFTATTDEEGYFETVLKVGTYDATASLAGFTDATADDIVIIYNGITSFSIIMHENYNPAAAVVAEEINDDLSKISWSLGSMPGGAGDEFFFDFEDGFQGWTSIDVDGDGYGWKQASTVMTGVYGHNNSADFVFSQSYDNSYGVLYPNNYLVTPQAYRIGGSSVFSMWACAQDASYSAEHFSVEVSEDGTTFTTVSEWTIGQKTAKSGQVRNERAQSTWIEYTADLSAYSGKQMYIAVRHFNCSDQFYLDVDDCSLANAANGGRSLQYYTVYRQQVLEEGAATMIPEEELDPEVIIAQCNDTVVLDANWGNMETGVYQYGVQVTYGGIHNPTREMIELVNENFDGGLPETWTNTSEGVNFWIASNLSQGESAYEGKSAFCNGTWERGIKSYLATPEIELDGSAASLSFVYRQRTWGGDQNVLSVVYGDNPDGPWTEIWSAGEVSVADWTEMTLDLSGVEASYIAFCNYNDYGYATGVDNVVITKPAPATPVTGITWSNMLPKNMDMNLDLVVTTATGADVRGAIAILENVSEPYLGLVYETELDSTGLFSFEGFRKGQYNVTVALAGYNTYEAEEAFWGDATYTVALQEAKEPITNLEVSNTGFAHWTAPATLVPEYYLVKMNNIAQGQTENPFMFLDVDGLVENQTYQVKVAAMYGTGMSDWVSKSFTYKACDNYASDIEEVSAFTDCMDVTFSWGSAPTPPVPPTPGEGDEFLEGFENGLPTGWTNLDADGDGYYWRRGTDYMTAPVGHNSNDCMFSNSYDNSYGALTPDNYLVTPQVLITTGSTFSFWACAQDASYAYEHYGVAVSTTTPTAGAFTTIAEWTMTAKDGAKGGRGTNAQGTWYNKSVDLSSYAGQQIYIAIRHFNCTDAFYLDVDDVQLAIVGKGNRGNGTFSAAGVAMEGNTELSRDGNWYGYDNGNANEDAIGTGGGNFWWGIMLPAGSFEGNKLSKVAAYDYMAMTGTVDIYQGGAAAPAGSSLGTANVSMSGSSQYIETEFATPITLDPTQNVWVVYYNGSAATYPAAVCANTGDANGRWVSLDGSSWADLASYGLSYTFMVRAYIEAGAAPGPQGPTVNPNSWALFLDGEFIECVDLETTTYSMTMTDTEEHIFTVRKVGSDYNMSCEEGVEFAAGGVSMPANLNVEDTEEGIMFSWVGFADTYKVYRGSSETNLVEIGETSELFFLDETSGDYFYGVRAITDCGQSDMAIVAYDNVNELNADTRIYPNPTKGDLYIYAQGMKQVTVINTLGQVVYNQSVKADEMTLNMSQFGAGMYIVNIVTENGTSAQRVNVIK